MREIDPIVLEACAFAIFKCAFPRTMMGYMAENRRKARAAKGFEAGSPDETIQRTWDAWQPAYKSEYFDMARACLREYRGSRPRVARKKRSTEAT